MLVGNETRNQQQLKCLYFEHPPKSQHCASLLAKIQNEEKNFSTYLLTSESSCNLRVKDYHKFSENEQVW